MFGGFYILFFFERTLKMLLKTYGQVNGLYLKCLMFYPLKLLYRHVKAGILFLQLCEQFRYRLVNMSRKKRINILINIRGRLDSYCRIWSKY